MKPLLAVLAAALLAGCGSTDAPPQASPPADDVPRAGPPDTAPAPVLVALDAEGLRLVEAATGRTRLLPFGAPEGVAEDALTRAWGPWRERSRLPDCGAEPPTLLGWANGVTVLLEGGAFAGWSASAPRPGDGEAPRPPVGTMAGLGVGSERREAERAYVLTVRETSLGTEFQAGGISGVLDGPAPDAEVTALWAGRACIFR